MVFRTVVREPSRWQHISVTFLVLIFDFLDCDTKLLRAERVCRSWNSVQFKWRRLAQGSCFPHRWRFLTPECARMATLSRRFVTTQMFEDPLEANAASSGCRI